MMFPLTYFFSASLFLLLFYGCYRLLLQRNTFFTLNRVYLLLSVGLSLSLPLLELPDDSPTVLSVQTLPTFTVGVNPVSDANWLETYAIWLLYGLGAGVALSRLLYNLRAVGQLIRRGVAETRSTYTLIRMPDDQTPSFSFGRYLVLSRSDALAESPALLHHEQAHIRQLHTLDVLFVELVQVIFWFNPVLWLYKRSLQEVHEFLADRAALTITNPNTDQADYAHLLVAYALDVPVAALITPFVSKSTLKQRILMLHKPASRTRSLLGYALVLPMATMLTLCTQHDPDQPMSEVGRARQATVKKNVKVEGEIFTVVEEQPEFPGGMKELGNYLGSNLKYPAAAQKAKAEGRVFVRFVVNKEGEISNVEILKGIGFGADEEAVRVVSQMPRWTPARQNGKVVNVRYNLPINFQLDEDKPAKGTGFSGMKSFTINGKAATQAEVEALQGDNIARMDVDTKKKAVAITLK